MAKKGGRKRFDPFIPSIIIIGVMIFFAIVWKYPSLVLSEGIDIPDAQEAAYSDRMQSPYANARFWCEEDLTWVTLVEGMPLALINIGITNEGRYEGFCHATSQDPKAGIDIYFNLQGSGYLVKDMDGKLIEIPFAD